MKIALQMVHLGLISRIWHTLQGSRWNSVIAMTGATIHLYIKSPFVWSPPFPVTPLIARTRRPPGAPAYRACAARSWARPVKQRLKMSRGGADENLDYHGGSSCIPTRNAFWQCSSTSNWGSVRQPPFAAWAIRKRSANPPLRVGANQGNAVFFQFHGRSSWSFLLGHVGSFSSTSQR